MFSSYIFRPSTSIVQQTRKVYRYSARSRKTGRGCGNCVKPSNEWRFIKATERQFTKLNGRRFGFDMGLEDRVLLNSLGQRNRRLDAKKMGQLAKIYEQRLVDIVSCHPVLGEHSVQFSRVKVNQSFTEVSVYWVCTGQNDDIVTSLLETERYSIRKTLGEQIGSTAPEVKFIPDRMNLLTIEMDNLFKKADYGVDYRTLSHTARVLGNTEKEAVVREEKKKDPPRWKIERMQRKGVPE